MDVDLHSLESSVLHPLRFNHYAPAGDSLEREDKIVINTDVNTERVWDKADFHSEGPFSIGRHIEGDINISPNSNFLMLKSS